MNIIRFGSFLILTGWLGLSGLAETPPAGAEFWAALRNNDNAGLRQFLDAGVSANARDAFGNTALIQAAAYADVNAVRLLLDHGAEVNATNAAGATALMRAAGEHDKVALLLERGADVQVRSVLGNTALMLAARPFNSHEAVEMLLARGADANATNRWGATALMAAAAGGDARSVELLLKHGAKPDAQPAMDPNGFVLGGGRSALMWAAFRGDIAIMKLLLEAGADVNGVGLLGTPLVQAAWSGQTAAARFLIERGAKVNQAGPMDGYTPLHWAASSEERDPALVQLLLEHGADPNAAGGEHVDAFMGTPQTPLMLARRRGDSPILAALQKGGATQATPERLLEVKPPARSLPEHLDAAAQREAINLALPPLQTTAVESKKAFVRHASRQDCVSCHQQMLPMAAMGMARKQHARVDFEIERQVIKMVSEGELRDAEPDWEALFHPDPVETKGYALLAMAAEDVPASYNTDAWVHHLSRIQGRDGQWYNNLPRPPIQTSDVGATALAVHALQRYGAPGRRAELAGQVERARRWLWKVAPENTEGRVYQILGLAWAGEPAEKLQSMAKALASEQRQDGGWAQLPGLASDAYATAQVIYALRVGADLGKSDRSVAQGIRYLLNNQLEDGTWYVHRRAFPFQPTMKSGFPHGRDSWISAAASSWAVMALSLPDGGKEIALRN